MVFAGIKAWIFARALANALDEGDRLIGAHRSAGIMTILFEIEHEQDTSRTRRRIGLRPCAGDNAEKMIGLSDGIGSVRVVIGAPEQTRVRGSLLPKDVLRIALERGIRGFMNYTDNSFVFHRHEIGTHQVVMRKIDDGAIGEGANLQRLKQKENAENGRFHPGTAGEYQSTIEAC